MQVTAVHEDLACWTGSSWKRRGWCWQEPGHSAGCLEHLGLGWVPGRQGVPGRPGDQHLEDAGRDGALMLSHAFAAPEAFLGFPSAHHSGREGYVLSHNRTTTTSTNYWTCPFHQVLFQAPHVHFLIQSCNNSVRYYYPLFSHITERSHFCFQRHDKVRGSAPEGPEEEPERG